MMVLLFISSVGKRGGYHTLFKLAAGKSIPNPMISIVPVPHVSPAFSISKWRPDGKRSPPHLDLLFAISLNGGDALWVMLTRPWRKRRGFEHHAVQTSPQLGLGCDSY
jgi:hypothetical protein